MKRKMPPLNALKAFEASARHLSFTNAAEELHVTQSAVSRQVKGLEDYLQIQLFDRYNRALELTDAGRAYLPGLRHGFDTIDQATQRIVVMKSSPRLTVRTSLPTIAQRWLTPRLMTFQEDRPNMEIRIITASKIVPIDFASEEIDVAFTREKFDHEDLINEEIMEEEIVAICSPYFQSSTPLKEKADVAKHRLIHNLGRIDLWNDWLDHFGVHNVDSSGDWRMAHFFLIIEAAMAGVGIALVPLVAVVDALNAGHLIAPFGDSFKTGETYKIVRHRRDKEAPHIQEFIKWLHKESSKVKL